MEIKFEEPEENPRKRYDHAAIAGVLRDNPGRWALIADDAPAAVARQIKLGLLVDYRPAGHFEATARGTVRGRGKVYVRYVGGETE